MLFALLAQVPGHVLVDVLEHRFRRCGVLPLPSVPSFSASLPAARTVFDDVFFERGVFGRRTIRRAR